MSNATPVFPRSGYDLVGGMVFFGRMIDKIRLQDAGQLPPGYYLGDAEPAWMDGRCTRHLGVTYPELVAKVRDGLSDDEVIQWCFDHGRKPTEEQMFIFNAFLCKRGWRDQASGGLAKEKEELGYGDRTDIQTFFDLQDAEEGRPPRFPA